MPGPISTQLSFLSLPAAARGWTEVGAVGLVSPIAPKLGGGKSLRNWLAVPMGHRSIGVADVGVAEVDVDVVSANDIAGDDDAGVNRVIGHEVVGGDDTVDNNQVTITMLPVTTSLAAMTRDDALGVNSLMKKVTKEVRFFSARTTGLEMKEKRRGRREEGNDGEKEKYNRIPPTT
ncbi:uncharacterized protein N7515_008857 [Penicillium bovifimosum]|uniref:Uncharacterized protein n=1 Tax=Penicillium bovifimosum TaxID=126998 RepID=A0A9W9GP36_9EURO|nr:uncharacterized protein N7515_008857 [Penicillium bovifimosum]KAJ5125032.1 hypothetical protein N7515_008857 [Penicillium bovifimosum]